MNKWKKGQRADRRALCPCGSGIKYKSCCFAADREAADGKIKMAKLTQEQDGYEEAGFPEILSVLLGGR